MPSEDTFAARLVAARERAGLSRLQLARAARLSESQVGRLERGASLPHPSTVMLLAGVLGVKEEELTGDEIRGEGRA